MTVQFCGEYRYLCSEREVGRVIRLSFKTLILDLQELQF